MLTAITLTALALLVWAALAFNRLVRLANLVREAWSGIDVQLKRRHDLVPNLAEVVRAHARFERDTLERVAELRTGGQASQALQDGENDLAQQVRGLLAVAEAYPELRATRSFIDLLERLTDVENQLQLARRYYNGTVRDYNTAVESFPSNLVASAFAFDLREFFQVESAIERNAPTVAL